MKNLFPKALLSLLILSSITSCSVDSLEDQDLLDNEIELKSNLSKYDEIIDTTLFISWKEDISESEKNNLREELMDFESTLQLHSFTLIDSQENPEGIEQWEITSKATESEVEKPLVWIKKKREIDFVSKEPF